MCVAVGNGQTFPVSGWTPVRDPIASPSACKGGTITLWGHSYPSSLNCYLDTTTTSLDIFNLMYSSLMDLNSLDASFEPNLAKKWEISPDKKTFTFHIDPQAVWSDGQAITSHDVKWTYDALMNPENLTGSYKAAMMRFNEPEVLDDRTIRFTAKKIHWLNLLSLAGFNVLPKHAMQGLDFNKINFEFPVVSGPYRIKTLKEGFSVALSRRPDWWLAGSPGAEGVYNFDEIKLRFIEKREDAYATFLKGQTDLHPIYTSRIWVKEAVGEAFDQNWVLKKKVFNLKPASLQGYIFNLRNPIFQDVRVRKALTLLNDRRRMNDTIMYGQYSMHRSYFEDIYDSDHPNLREEVLFDPNAARQLLDAAGWRVNPQTGYREKDGKRLSFRFLYYDPGQDKFLSIFNEALKNAGIEMTRERKDWAAWSKDLDEFNFEISQGAWRGSLFRDAQMMWHSEEADRTAGQNYSGFRNAEVDGLIEQGKSEFDVRKRRELLQKIDAVLVRESPFILNWFSDYTRLMYWNKFGMPETVLDKYGDEGCIYRYWWIDKDRAGELVEAREGGIMLPAEPVEIRFDEVSR